MGRVHIPHLIYVSSAFSIRLCCACPLPFHIHVSMHKRLNILQVWAGPAKPTRNLDNFRQIQREVQEALLAIHLAEGDETDAAPEQVDCARKIQNLSKEILGRLAVAPTEDWEDEENNETLEPYELFRTSWDCDTA